MTFNRMADFHDLFKVTFPLGGAYNDESERDEQEERPNSETLTS